MTLIKSTDGSGWVEARVKDKVCFHPSEPLVIAKIDGSVIHFEYGERTHVPELLQLVERPFQVGMPIQCKRKIDAEWVDEICTEEHLSQRFVSSHHIRHSSPLLRPVGGV